MSYCNKCGQWIEEATLEDCRDMMKQIEGIENRHGGVTSITMTTAEARRFVVAAMEWCKKNADKEEAAYR